MIFAAIQWVLDSIGKIGPLAIAVAVYLANQRQIRWTNAVAVRAASVEDQKMRLALLDRRLAVLNHLQIALDELNPAKRSMQPMFATLDALKEAELVFEEEQRLEILDCFQSITAYQTKYTGIFEELRGEELGEAIKAYQGCINRIMSVRSNLQAASRVQSVIPLTMPEPML